MCSQDAEQWKSSEEQGLVIYIRRVSAQSWWSRLNRGSDVVLSVDESESISRLPKVIYPKYKQFKVTMAPATPLVSNFYNGRMENRPIQQIVSASAAFNSIQKEQEEQDLSQLLFRSCGHEVTPLYQSRMDLLDGVNNGGKKRQRRAGKVCSHCYERLQHLSPRQLAFQERKTFFESLA